MGLHVHVLCDCDAIAHLQFRHLGQFFMEPNYSKGKHNRSVMVMVWGLTVAHPSYIYTYLHGPPQPITGIALPFFFFKIKPLTILHTIHLPPSTIISLCITHKWEFKVQCSPSETWNPFIILIITYLSKPSGACSSVVSWGTMVQAGRSKVWVLMR
jgi:hypothetical protein